MTLGISPTTVINAGAIMAPVLGLSWKRDREEVLGVINDYRNLLYNSYPQFQLFNNVFHCICLSCFDTPCAGGCSPSSSYHGFSLPPDVEAVEAAWEYGHPLELRSRWRESHVGINGGLLGKVEVIETAFQSPIERDLDRVGTVKLFAEAIEDNEKIVAIQVRDLSGAVRHIEVPLTGGGWVEPLEEVYKIESVVLPEGRKGAVTLSQGDGRVLSVYEPFETVPLFRRFKVVGSCKSGNIFIQGIRRFLPVFRDTDIVEVGDPLIMKHAASYFRYSENTTDQKSLNRAEYSLSKMSAQLAGAVARSRGNAVQDGPATVPRKIRTSNILPGYQR